MCKCEYATRQANGTFHCGKFNLYGWDGPLLICMSADIEKSWNQRLSQVPHQVKERERAYLGFVGVMG